MSKKYTYETGCLKGMLKNHEGVLPPHDIPSAKHEQWYKWYMQQKVCASCPYSFDSNELPDDCHYFRSGIPYRDMKKLGGECVFCGTKVKTYGRAHIEVVCPKCKYVYFSGSS